MASTSDNPFLTQLGLTNSIFREDGGKLASNMLETSLGYVTNLSVSIDVRTDIARMISKWQEQATPANRHDGFKQNYFKVVETIGFILLQPQNTSAGSDVDVQAPAFYLSVALAREAAVTQLSTFGAAAGSVLVELFKAAINQTSEFREDPLHPHSRTHCIRNIVSSLPDQGTNEQLDSVLTLLFQTLPKLSSAPLLQKATVSKIHSILSTNTSAHSPTNRHLPTPSANNSTSAQFLFDAHLTNILHAIRCGHTQLATIVTSNKTLCSAHNATVEQHLSAMIESLGVGALEVLLQDLADLEPRKLLPSLPALVQQLRNGNVLVQHKMLILGVLLSVVQVQGSAPLVPLLGSVGSACSDQPELYIPMFKLLTTVSICSVSNSSGSNEDVTTQALVLVSSIAKSASPKTPSIQSAILDCVNILKDQCKYSNIFHADTLKVFEAFSVYNTAAYNNIILWNSGKSAKKGNNAVFLINAGAVSASSSSGGWWFSPKKSSSVSNSNSVSNSVSISSSSAASSPVKGGIGYGGTNSGYGGGNAEIRGAEGVNSPLSTHPVHYTQPQYANPYPTNPYPTPFSPAPYTSTPYSPQHTTLNSTSLPPHTTPLPNRAHSVAPSPQSQNLALLQQQLNAQQQHIQHQMLLMQQLQIQEQLAMYEQSSMGSGGVGGSISGSMGGGVGSGGNAVTSSGIYGTNANVSYQNATVTYPNYEYASNINNAGGGNPYIVGVQSAAGMPLVMGINPPQSPTHHNSGMNSAYNTHNSAQTSRVAPTQLFPTNVTTPN